MRRRYIYTREELLAAIKQFHSKYGRIPTRRDTIDSDILPSSKCYYNQFDSWAEAIRLAGFVPRHRRRFQIVNRKKKYTKNDLLNYLRKYYLKYHRVPTGNDTEKSCEMPNIHTYRIYFGSWNKAIQLAGFKPRKYKDENLFSRFIWLQILIKYIIDWIRS